MNSTRDLSQLPDVEGLRKLLQSLAMLDAVVCREWQYRYYSFNARWYTGEQMGSMRNGCGDDFFALFNAAGCFLKGFAHEAPMSPYAFDPPTLWPGVLMGVPEEFSSGLKEPAFKMATRPSASGGGTATPPGSMVLFSFRQHRTRMVPRTYSLRSTVGQRRTRNGRKATTSSRSVWRLSGTSTSIGL
jgi:hypothetical protein